MQVLVFMIFAITLSGCSALMIGGGASSGSAIERDRSAGSSRPSDLEISRRVRTELAANPETSGFPIAVRTSGGLVILSGTVSGFSSKETAEKLAVATDGVRAVDNQITVVYTN